MQINDQLWIIPLGCLAVIVKTVCFQEGHHGVRIM